MTATPTPAPLLDDDLKQLQDALDQHVTFYPGCVTSYNFAEWLDVADPERIARLLAHIAELDAKAKRYDYLRDMPVEIPSLGPEVTHWDGEGSGDAIRGSELDEAIDTRLAAIASEAKG